MIPQAEMDSLLDTVREIGELLQKQYDCVIRSLETKDVKCLSQIKVVEGQINALHAKVENLTFRLIALYQPVAKDLRTIIMTLRTSIDLERICDYIESNARIIRQTFDTLPEGLTEAIDRLFRAAGEMAVDIFRAYLDEDAVKAVEVWNRDQVVNELYHDFIISIGKCPDMYGTSSEVCRKMSFLAKNCERLGDHATNIAEHIYFQVNGVPMNVEKNLFPAS